MSAQHTPATRALQKRLEAMELEHLRALATAQARRIERLKHCNQMLRNRVQYWRERSYDSDARADMFWDHNRQLEEALEGQQTGLTMDGRLVLIPAEGAHA